MPKTEEIRTDVKEDKRLFHPNRGGTSGEDVRYNTWFPFDSKFWPFKSQYSEIDLDELRPETAVVLLERTFDPDKGHFIFKLKHFRGRIDKGIHPQITSRYQGFMLLSPDAAMAALLIPASAKDVVA